MVRCSHASKKLELDFTMRALLWHFGNGCQVAFFVQIYIRYRQEHVKIPFMDISANGNKELKKKGQLKKPMIATVTLVDGDLH